MAGARTATLPNEASSTAKTVVQVFFAALGIDRQRQLRGMKLVAEPRCYLDDAVNNARDEPSV